MQLDGLGALLEHARHVDVVARHLFAEVDAERWTGRRSGGCGGDRGGGEGLEGAGLWKRGGGGAVRLRAAATRRVSLGGTSREARKRSTHESLVGGAFSPRSALPRHLPVERELLHERLEVLPHVDRIDDALDASTCAVKEQSAVRPSQAEAQGAESVTSPSSGETGEMVRPSVTRSASKR